MARFVFGVFQSAIANAVVWCAIYVLSRHPVKARLRRMLRRPRLHVALARTAEVSVAAGRNISRNISDTSLSSDRVSVVVHRG